MPMSSQNQAVDTCSGTRLQVPLPTPAAGCSALHAQITSCYLDQDAAHAVNCRVCCRSGCTFYMDSLWPWPTHPMCSSQLQRSPGVTSLCRASWSRLILHWRAAPPSASRDPPLSDASSCSCSRIWLRNTASSDLQGMVAEPCEAQVGLLQSPSVAARVHICLPDPPNCRRICTTTKEPKGFCAAQPSAGQQAAVRPAHLRADLSRRDPKHSLP